MIIFEAAALLLHQYKAKLTLNAVVCSSNSSPRGSFSTGMSVVVNRWLNLVCTGPRATCVRILAQLSRMTSCNPAESSSSNGTAAGAIAVSS